MAHAHRTGTIADGGAGAPLRTNFRIVLAGDFTRTERVHVATRDSAKLHRRQPRRALFVDAFDAEVFGPNAAGSPDISPSARWGTSTGLATDRRRSTTSARRLRATRTARATCWWLDGLIVVRTARRDDEEPHQHGSDETNERPHVPQDATTGMAGIAAPAHLQRKPVASIVSSAAQAPAQ